MLIFHEGLTTHVDDEYAWAGVEDPKIVVTTSHNPSSRLKQFAKVCMQLLGGRVPRSLMLHRNDCRTDMFHIVATTFMP